MQTITVRKLDLAGKVMFQYSGHLVHREPHVLVLEALFAGGDTPVADVLLKTGDRFIETYYDRRWYNVFEIQDGTDGPLKGWYCNLSRPAVLYEDSVSWVDLALDLWVGADGRQVVLDRDEFEALPATPDDCASALAALEELQRLFKQKRPPF